jgi:hypothetical protein
MSSLSKWKKSHPFAQPSHGLDDLLVLCRGHRPAAYCRLVVDSAPPRAERRSFTADV